MRQLYIDGKPAVIKSGTSFKFYRENIYFTDAEDYTLEVTLPLQGCPENLAIFSAIHRPEMSAVHLIGKKFPFHFIAPPLDIQGSAIVTEVSDTEVKVQLLAGSSVFNFDKTDALGHDIYIDELDLGCAYDVSLKDIYTEAYKSVRPHLYLRDYLTEALNNKTNGVDMHATYDNSPDGCVTFTVYSETTEHTANKHFYVLRNTEEGGAEYLFLLKAHNNGYGIPYDSVYIAAQPYLLLIVERVLKCIGYTLNPDNAIASSWQRNIFIANVRNEYQYAKILPHWTVSEFLKEVSLFCGVIFITEGTTVNAVRKSDYYGDRANIVHLSEAIDEFTTEISEEEEGSKDTRTGNVGYDFESIDPMLQMPDEVWNKATIIEPFYDEGSMIQWIVDNITDSEKSSSNWLFSHSGKTYAYIQVTDGTYSLTEVDMCGNIIRDGSVSRDIDVMLRIVPSLMRLYTIDFKAQGLEVEKDIISISMLATQSARDKMVDTYSVNDAIHPDSEKNEYTKPERIEVALNSGGTKTFSFADKFGNSAKAVIPMPTGIPYVRDAGDVEFTELFTTSLDHKHLLLKQGISTGMYDILSAGAEIDTRCRKVFQFLDNIEMSPKDVFIIRGRKYACEKVEYTCDDNGISPLKRGYFYEIND